MTEDNPPDLRSPFDPDSAEAESSQVPEVLPDSPDRLAMLRIAAESHSGPLPAPKVLEQYDAIVPGAAERILLRFEEQANHRIELESAVVKSGILHERLGIVLGFVLAAFGFALAGFAISKGQSLAGVTLFVFQIAALAGVYVYGSHKRDDDLRQRIEDEVDE